MKKYLLKRTFSRLEMFGYGIWIFIITGSNGTIYPFFVGLIISTICIIISTHYQLKNE